MFELSTHPESMLVVWVGWGRVPSGLWTRGSRPPGNGDDKPGETVEKQMIDPKAWSSTGFPGLCLVMFHVHIGGSVLMGSLHLPVSPCISPSLANLGNFADAERYPQRYRGERLLKLAQGTHAWKICCSETNRNQFVCSHLHLPHECFQWIPNSKKIGILFHTPHTTSCDKSLKPMKLFNLVRKHELWHVSRGAG